LPVGYLLRDGQVSVYGALTLEASNLVLASRVLLQDIMHTLLCLQLWTL
jgi:hypothetical protein